MTEFATRAATAFADVLMAAVVLAAPLTLWCRPFRELIAWAVL